MAVKMYLSLSELEDVVSLCKKMNVDRCTLVQNSSSGIGSSLKVEIKTNIHDYYGDFVVDFTDESTW